MIFEYALEPSLLDNWKDVRYFKDNCGIDKGRLISEYPRKWVRMVFDVIRESDCGDVEKKKMKEALRNIEKHKTFKRPKLSWNDNKNWLDNVVEEHKTRLFRAIIGNCTTDESKCIVSGEDLNESIELWNCDCGSIHRKALTMAQAVAPLLVLSQHIKFIDPYFNPDKPWFRNPLIEMLKIVSYSDNGIPIPSVEYHISNTPNRRDYDEFDAELFKDDVNRHLRPHISNKISLSFIQWDASEMHNRYIVTNVGCLRFGIGLDEDTRSADARDEIERLNDIKWAEITTKYSGGNSFYSVTGEIEEEV